jgi:predicted DNA-binding mobile mystery protein A
MAMQTAARRRLDQRLGDLGSGVGPRPKEGWIRAIRDALGMSGAELGRRLDVSAQAVSAMEASERAGSIRLGTLHRAADALDCDVVYALVPRQSLQTAVEVQAMRKAREHLAPIAHHARLEDQAVGSEELEDEVGELAARFIGRRGLWTLETGA